MSEQYREKVINRICIYVCTIKYFIRRYDVLNNEEENAKRTCLLIKFIVCVFRGHIEFILEVGSF